jgi:hypothetical protein
MTYREFKTLCHQVRCATSLSSRTAGAGYKCNKVLLALYLCKASSIKAPLECPAPTAPTSHFADSQVYAETTTDGQHMLNLPGFPASASHSLKPSYGPPPPGLPAHWQVPIYSFCFKFQTHTMPDSYVTERKEVVGWGGGGSGWRKVAGVRAG